MAGARTPSLRAVLRWKEKRQRTNTRSTSLFHLGAGLTRWLELNLSAGGLPLPAAGGIAIAGHGVAGAGGAGIVVVAAGAIGARVRVLEEGPVWPGVAVGYDLVDAFGAPLGAGGVFFAGNGVAGLGGAGAAFANVQLNVSSLAASKRLGAFELGAGALAIGA